jgi:putative transposase
VCYNLNYVSWKLRKTVAADLHLIYAAATVEEGETRSVEFEAKWGADYPVITQSWRRNWTRIIPFSDFPQKSEESSTPPMPLSR